MNEALWVLGLLVPAFLIFGVFFLRKTVYQVKLRREWDPWAHALGLGLSISSNREARLRGVFNTVPVIVMSTGAPATASFHFKVNIMSMTRTSFSFPEHLSEASKANLSNVRQYIQDLQYTGATLNAHLRPQDVRLDLVLDVLSILTHIAQEITDHELVSSDTVPATTHQQNHIRLAQFLEQNLAMQHTGRPSGWELTGLTTFIGHHVSFLMVVQSIDQTGTLKGPLNHSVYTVVVTNFPIDSDTCPAPGSTLHGIGTITHLNVISRTAVLTWRTLA